MFLVLCSNCYYVFFPIPDVFGDVTFLMLFYLENNRKDIWFLCDELCQELTNVELMQQHHNHSLT